MTNCNQKCTTCDSASPKYRCPKCADVRYCSAACYKEHALGEHDRSNGLDVSPLSTEEQSGPKEIDLPDQSGQLPDMEGLLTRKQMHALATDEKIAHQLKSRELQELMRCIDKSRSRLDALETAEHNIPEFAAFAEHVAQVLFESR
ncbi:Zinc finger HIT-type [Perkinsela sp. CCAP 1560/4]|nr:hypothetical protein XU18_3592 [Perkinsela sp. CCAP 1560/4]KNH07927.1 Zinc finger HIT-type [Perkinsela sp. CCAP 1560/4]|eukprot:KNH05421.1 hypothetical protein XU18_3592 [Perkinsela sp. CCAP 1560/4]